MRIGIEVHNNSFKEMCVVIVGGNLEFSTCNRDIESGADTGINSSLLIKIIDIAENSTSTWQHISKVAKKIWRTIAHTYGSA